VRGARDELVGLKENIIIGHLIPAGTGVYRNMDVEFLVEEPFVPEEEFVPERKVELSPATGGDGEAAPAKATVEPEAEGAAPGD